ncbi:MAG: hypothetical protein AAFM92_03130 [Pseudomonadota bacterium]
MLELARAEGHRPLHLTRQSLQAKVPAACHARSVAAEKRRERIVQTLSQSSPMTNAEISELLKIPLFKAQADTRHLIEAGRIQRIFVARDKRKDEVRFTALTPSVEESR